MTDHSFATIVIVITESADSNGFREFVNEIYHTHKLDRIVFDEAHKLLTDTRYRHGIAEVRSLGFPVQFIFLSATFSPQFGELYEKHMLIEDPEYVRDFIYKRNARYAVKIVEEDDVQPFALQFIKSAADKYKEKGKVLGFCRTHRECNGYAGRLGCGSYISTSTDEEHEEILDDWSSGPLMASGSLGAGVDIDVIKEVIHIGEPYGLIDFFQEGGRGGRNGDVVLSTIIISRSERQKLVEMDPLNRSIDERAMREFIMTDECRNKVLTGYLNGVEHAKTCVELDAQLCDLCQRTHSNSALGKRQRTEDDFQAGQRKRAQKYDRRQTAIEDEQMMIASRWEYLEEIYRIIGEGCPICWFRGKEEFDHRLKECNGFRSEIGMKWSDFRGANIGWEGSVNTCWLCVRPGDRCKMYSSHRRCQSLDCVLPIVAFAYLFPQSGYKDVIHRVAGREFPDTRTFGRWLTGAAKGKVLGENGSNAFACWDEILKRRMEYRIDN
jgi:hypothetical protein